VAGSTKSLWRARRAPAAIAVIVAVVIGAAVGAYALAGGSGSDGVKGATARFRDVAAAEGAQYGRFLDTAGIACIDMPGEGAMGIHYVNQALVGDGAVDARHPEALVYDPGDGDDLRLAAVEYVVVQEQWMATHDGPPSLFGQEFMLTPAPNRFGLPAFYSLHAWVWERNPAGRYAMWNPDVHCPGAVPSATGDGY
jgi:hypothetical protein